MRICKYCLHMYICMQIHIAVHLQTCIVDVQIQIVYIYISKYILLTCIYIYPNIYCTCIWAFANIPQYNGPHSVTL